jgi:leucyl aminopeptidase
VAHSTVISGSSVVSQHLSSLVRIHKQGLTFDSGGYNIKAGAGSMIELMKFDMGGAGATLGAAKVSLLFALQLLYTSCWLLAVALV